jgi:hypothetical protein
MTPASDRPSPARATAGRQRDRSSRASCGPAARRFPPARPDAGRADPAQLLQDEAPPRRCLPRHLKLRTVETRQEPAHALTVRRRDARPRDLARRRVDPLRSDLRPMLIKPHHDRHARHHLPSAPPAQARRANHRAQRPARPIAYRDSRSVPPFEWPAARPQSARACSTPFDAEDRPPSPPARRPAHAIVASVSLRPIVTIASSGDPSVSSRYGGSLMQAFRRSSPGGYEVVNEDY